MLSLIIFVLINLNKLISAFVNTTLFTSQNNTLFNDFMKGLQQIKLNLESYEIILENFENKYEINGNLSYQNIQISIKFLFLNLTKF